jgi:hypothetical protein
MMAAFTLCSNARDWSIEGVPVSFRFRTQPAAAGGIVWGPAPETRSQERHAATTCAPPADAASPAMSHHKSITPGTHETVPALLSNEGGSCPLLSLSSLGVGAWRNARCRLFLFPKWCSPVRFRPASATGFCRPEGACCLGRRVVVHGHARKGPVRAARLAPTKEAVAAGGPSFRRQG